MSVKRYYNSFIMSGHMIESEDGAYVLYSDYAALEGKRDKRAQEIMRLVNINEQLHEGLDALVEALPDPDKLEILARWFDMKYPSDANPEVQADLRGWVKKIRRALEEK